jgi:hypothetical protein
MVVSTIFANCFQCQLPVDVFTACTSILLIIFSRTSSTVCGVTGQDALQTSKETIWIDWTTLHSVNTTSYIHYISIPVHNWHQQVRFILSLFPDCDTKDNWILSFNDKHDDYCCSNSNSFLTGLKCILTSYSTHRRRRPAFTLMCVQVYN